MTKTQFRKKFNELKKTSNKRMTELAEKALASGAINLESWEDDYRLPKVVMTAVCSSLEWDWSPTSNKELEAEVKNLKCFI